MKISAHAICSRILAIYNMHVHLSAFPQQSVSANSSAISNCCHRADSRTLRANSRTGCGTKSPTTEAQKHIYLLTTIPRQPPSGTSFRLSSTGGRRGPVDCYCRAVLAPPGPPCPYHGLLSSNRLRSNRRRAIPARSRARADNSESRPAQTPMAASAREGPSTASSSAWPPSEGNPSSILEETQPSSLEGFPQQSSLTSSSAGVPGKRGGGLVWLPGPPACRSDLGVLFGNSGVLFGNVGATPACFTPCFVSGSSCFGESSAPSASTSPYNLWWSSRSERVPVALAFLGLAGAIPILFRRQQTNAGRFAGGFENRSTILLPTVRDTDFCNFAGAAPLPNGHDQQFLLPNSDHPFAPNPPPVKSTHPPAENCHSSS